MFTRALAVPVMAAALLLAAGCGSNSDDNGSSSGGSGSSATTKSSSSSGGGYRSSSGQSSSGTSMSSGSGGSSSGGETITTAQDSDLGTYLVDEDGKALYLFEKDKRGSGKSTCSGACAQVWPPVTTKGDPQPEKQAKGSELSTLKRKDGSSQVVYNGWPLYYYAPDSKGTTKGEGVDGFGAEWYVLAPAGHKIEKGES